MERLVMFGHAICVCFTAWEQIPGLCQGVTLKAAQGAQEFTFGRFREGLRDEGFSRVRTLRQRHGARVLNAGEIPDRALPVDSTETQPEADGLVGREPGVLGVVTTADCVPVFMFDRVSSVWGLVHAGWRGVAGGVLEESLRILARDFGIRPERLEIYLGPAICGSCYEVGPEVAEQLARSVKVSGIEPAKGPLTVNLRRLLALQAASFGVPAAGIYASLFCTRCHNHLFHSCRAEGRAALGRMWAFIGNRGKK